MRLSSALLLFLTSSTTTLSTVYGQSITASTDNFIILSSPGNGRSRDLPVLDNDFETDANGNNIGNGDMLISRNIVTQPTDGTCVVKEDQKAIFWRTPGNNNGFRGTTTCRYQVCNSKETCVEAFVNLTVQPLRAIRDRDISVQPGQNTQVRDVIKNDLRQPTDRVLRVTSVTKLSGRGSCSTVANNASLVRYTRPSNNNEATTTLCEYTVCTSRLPTEPTQPTEWCDTAVAVFKVDARAAPTYVARADNSDLLPASISGKIDVLNNDTSNRNKVVQSIITNPQFGTCSINADRNGVIYTRPSSFQSGTVTCRYQGCTVPLNTAEPRKCGQADVTITVSPPTASVTSIENSYDINLDTLTNFISRRLEVLRNDFTNPPDRTIRIDSVSSPIDNGGGANSGRCVITGDGEALQFVPQGNNRVGQEVVCTYIACTNDFRPKVCGASTRVLIRLIGNDPGPDFPVANNDAFTIFSQDGIFFLPVLANDLPGASPPLRVFTTYTPTLPWVPFGPRRSTDYPDVFFPFVGDGLEIGSDGGGDRKLLLTQEEGRKLQKRGKVTIGIDGFTNEEVGIEEEPVVDEIILIDSSLSTEGGLCGPSNDRLGVDYIPPNGGDFTGFDECAYIACNRFGNCDDALIRIFVEDGTRVPTYSPTLSPSVSPTLAPTLEPTFSPSAPTLAPTLSPTIQPSLSPTLSPTLAPTLSPTLEPTLEPTDTPSAPTLAPTLSPTLEPTLAPTLFPTELPTLLPTELPTISPSLFPTVVPTVAPSLFPTASPTESPSFTPTVSPTNSPNVQIVQDPPTFFPTFFPTVSPTKYDPCKDDYWGWGGWDSSSSSSSSGSWDNDWWNSSKSRRSGRRRLVTEEEEEEHPEERRLSKSSKSKSSKRGGRWEWNNRCKTSSKSGKGRKSGKGYRRWGNSGGWQKPKPSGWNKPKPSSGWKGGGRPRYFKASSVNATEVVNGDELI